MSRNRVNWVQKNLDKSAEVSPLAGDASFRSYHRVLWDRQYYVLMDAPPDKEDVQPFLKVRSWLHDAGLNVPKIIKQDINHGYLLLEDFGDTTWAVFLQENGIQNHLFEDGLRQLHQLQTSQAPSFLPVFDMERMRTECDLYLDWYLPYVKQVQPTQAMRHLFHNTMKPSLIALDALPKVPVHLDYHCRNLMLPQQKTPLGVIDFQDAVLGTPTYDIASLLYDCYQDYPESIRRYWSQKFYQALPFVVQASFHSFDHWHKMVRLSAMQRHFKALGIFARLAYRDGKIQFLDEIPLTHHHLLEESHALGFQNRTLLLN